jgi:hypothetical protein
MKKTQRGVLTMAYGKNYYIRMAKTLAKSLKLHSDQTARAIVTDSDDPELRQLYDVCIPLRREWGSGLKQKLYLDKYTCFEETLFVDSDSIVFKDVERLWEFFSNVSFGVEGVQAREGKAFWNLMDISKTISLLNLNSIPLFNGGMYHFKNDDTAAEVFRKAREVATDYERFDLGEKFITEEPVFAIALASSGIDAVSDEMGLTMRTPYKMIGNINVDVLKGVASFNKNGRHVSPAIVHFAGNACPFEYKRERLKLDLASKLSVANHDKISFLVNLGFSCIYPAHAGYSFIRNASSNEVVRRLLRPIVKPIRDNFRATN